MVTVDDYSTSADYVISTVDNLLFIHWRASMPVTAVAELREAVEALHQQRPDGLALFTVVDPDVGTPEVAARQGVAEFLRWGDGKIRASALIIPGQGMRATWARAIATTISLASRTSYQSKCFAEPQDGLRWLGASVSVADTTADYILGKVGSLGRVA